MTYSILSATEAAARIRDGRITAVDLVKSCLERIEATDGQLKAWAHLDRESALRQAAALDDIRRNGRPLGRLHGIPVGLKDIIDTVDFKTECGSPVMADRQPDCDATLVWRLREAGAIILGKTVTTEFAYMRQAETHNPHNPEYSPGGSSSGSAAAVAAGHVPLAIGTQTNGSVIRPASFCGVFGFKPTFGVISRTGILRTSATLDQVGLFGRSLEDVALLADAIAGHDPADGASRPIQRPQMLEGLRTDVPVKPALAWFDLPFADRLADDAREGFEELLEELGDLVEKLPSPKAFAGLIDVQRTIQDFEIAENLGEIHSQHSDRLSAELNGLFARVEAISRAQYEDALATMEHAREFFSAFFKDYDAVIAPSAPGEAPGYGGGTGDPIFCTIWTLAGLPALNLPLLVGGNSMPIGVQLIGSEWRDDRLLRTAGWLLSYLDKEHAKEVAS